MSLPAEFFSIDQLRHYESRPTGWHRCPLGYQFLVALDSLGRRIVVPGILTPDDGFKRRKFPDLVKFTKAQVEEYLAPHLSRVEDVRDERDGLSRALTHDLRAISTEIYHQALVSQDLAAQSRSWAIVQALRSVLAAQQMMSVRLDIIDYESGQALSKPREPVAVFKKVDKVFRCFGTAFESKSIKSSFEGASFATSLGPQVLEIVPFVIIENAIKYSPYNGYIDVNVVENLDSVQVDVTSLGPCIAGNEKMRIFDKGFRGGAAKRLQSTGSGIGLYAAYTLVVEHFSGVLDVSQSADRTYIDGVNYYQTRFSMRLPITGFDRHHPRRKIRKRY